MAAKKKTVKRRTYSRRKKTRKSKAMSMARLAGLGITVATMWKGMKDWGPEGRDIGGLGEQLVMVTTGYDISGENGNTASDIGKRALAYWGPALAGELVHQVAGNPKGAFGTGFGFKMNNSVRLGRFNI
jgi:hypothetical protein